MKHLLHKWTLLILALLKPLGIWGVMGFAAVDAAFLGMPLDAIVAGYVWADPHRLLLYSAMAVLVGFQAVAFSAFSRVFAVVEGLKPSTSSATLSEATRYSGPCSVSLRPTTSGRMP